VQIKNKCIQLDFDEERVQTWVRELTTVDKRVQGLKDFEWNETVTPESKHHERQKRLAQAEKEKKRKQYLAEKEAKQKEYLENKAKRDAEREEKKAAAQARREAKEAERAAAAEAAKANQDAEAL